MTTIFSRFWMFLVTLAISMYLVIPTYAAQCSYNNESDVFSESCNQIYTDNGFYEECTFCFKSPCPVFSICYRIDVDKKTKTGSLTYFQFNVHSTTKLNLDWVKESKNHNKCTVQLYGEDGKLISSLGNDMYPDKKYANYKKNWATYELRDKSPLDLSQCLKEFWEDGIIPDEAIDEVKPIFKGLKYSFDDFRLKPKPMIERIRQSLPENFNTEDFKKIVTQVLSSADSELHRTEICRELYEELKNKKWAHEHLFILNDHCLSNAFAL